MEKGFDLTSEVLTDMNPHFLFALNLSVTAMKSSFLGVEI